MLLIISKVRLKQIFKLLSSAAETGFKQLSKKHAFEEHMHWDFPGGPMAKTPCFQCRGPGFDPYSGN